MTPHSTLYLNIFQSLVWVQRMIKNSSEIKETFQWGLRGSSTWDTCVQKNKLGYHIRERAWTTKLLFSHVHNDSKRRRNGQKGMREKIFNVIVSVLSLKENKKEKSQ